MKLATHKRKGGPTDPHERKAVPPLAEALRSHGKLLALPPQQKVSGYMISRMEEVPLREVIREEDYVRRNCTQAEVERIVSAPEFVETARQRLGSL